MGALTDSATESSRDGSSSLRETELWLDGVARAQERPIGLDPEHRGQNLAVPGRHRLCDTGWAKLGSGAAQWSWAHDCQFASKSVRGGP
jgi:hypothetical protein